MPVAWSNKKGEEAWLPLEDAVCDNLLILKTSTLAERLKSVIGTARGIESGGNIKW